MCIGQLQLSLYLFWDNPHIPEYGSPHVRYSLNHELQLSCLFYMVRINLVFEHSYFCKGHIIFKYYINEHYVYQTKSAKFKKPYVCTFPVVTKTGAYITWPRFAFEKRNSCKHWHTSTKTWINLTMIGFLYSIHINYKS